jgi:hypothetical protein
MRNGVKVMEHVYKCIFEPLVLYGAVSVRRVCIVGANGCICFFYMKLGISHFLPFSMNIDVMCFWCHWTHAILFWWFVGNS